MPMKKSPSKIKVGKKTYDKAYVGPFSKKEAYDRTASLRKKGLASRARKYPDGYHVYVGKFYTKALKKRAQRRGR